MELCYIEKFRELVKSYLHRHQYESAIFWGDKIVTLSGGNPVDVYWLAQAYYSTQQYHRACLLINNHSLTNNGSLCYLAALCHYKVQDYKSALDLLESPIWTDINCLSGQSCPSKINSNNVVSVPELDDDISLSSSRYLLLAKIYEATDKSAQACESYQAALAADPLCYDALKALTDHHMLSLQEEADLHSALPLSSCCDSQQIVDFVKVCYQTKKNRSALVLPSNVEKTSTSDSSPSVTKCNNQNIDFDRLPASLSLLSKNLDILTAKAEHLYYKCNFMTCFQITTRVCQEDPYHTDCLPIHIACLIELEQSHSLYLLAHKLVDLYPETALAWYAVGAYYYLSNKYELSRRYLTKAMTIDKVFGPAWIAFGHSFAAENEHDQANAAYFKAAQLMKGSHLPLLYIGMEYCLTNNPKFAEKFFQKAIEMSPEDPFVLHELGVVNFQNHQYDIAEMFLRRAIAVVSSVYSESNNYYSMPGSWMPLYSNLGHCLRKQGKYNEALQCHYQALQLQPRDALTFTCIAMCLALMDKLEEAVEALHNSLSVQRDQTVASSLLNRLLDVLSTRQHLFLEYQDDCLPWYSNVRQRLLDAQGEEQPIEYLTECDAGPPTSTRVPLATLMADPLPLSQGSVDSPSVMGSSSSTPATGGGASLFQEDQSLLSVENMIMDDDSD